MDATAIVRRLEGFPSGISSVVQGLTLDEARWKPASGAWSVLEIMCHLGDEEVDDFRARVIGTLKDPAAKWGVTDPEAWAVARRYNEQDFQGAVARFAAERAESVRALRELAAPFGGDIGKLPWTNAYQHPRIGPVTAGELFAAWVGHDALHLRQVAKRLWELAGRDGAPHTLAYAGEWKA